jgi:hypothetical protein
LTFAHPGFNLFSFFGFGRPSHAPTPTSICSNTTTAQSYLSQTLALINNLQANSTYNSTLKLQSANFVSYLQNTTNQALLSTNCTIFFTNLKAARLADKAAERTRQQITSEIERKFEQVTRNVTGSNELYELEELQF